MSAASAARHTLGLGARAARAVDAVKPGKAAAFFREVARCLPWVLRTYKLEELTTVPALRASVAELFRQNAAVATPQVVDLLVYKGREELEMVLLNHKQRHHLVAQYVRLPETLVAREALPGGGPPPSAFLEAFYRGG